MSLLHFPSSSSNPLLFNSISSLRPISAIKKQQIAPSIPARDTVIDFGKFRGRMLGTLPSTYLKWISKNLRARDFHEWAERADQVLSDPVYSDRMEWEFAQKILSGDDSRIRSENPVSDLWEISQRFGWDNEDKSGWNKVDFDLLGTSKGARIPRIKQKSMVVSGDHSEKLQRERDLGYAGADLKKAFGSNRDRDPSFLSSDSSFSKAEKVGSLRKNSGFSQIEKLGSLGWNSGFSETGKLGSSERNCEAEIEGKLGSGSWNSNDSKGSSEQDMVRERRETRRTKRRLKREGGIQLQMHQLRKEVGIDLEEEEGNGDQTNGNLNPFPGRDALLKKFNM